jgi:hypothetical protein
MIAYKSLTIAERFAKSDAFIAFCLVAMSMLVAGTGGCKKSSGTVSVSGKITFRGAPLSSAVMNYYPATGRAVPASVNEGEYTADLVPGDYVVAVTLGAKFPPGFKEGDPIPSPKIVLPPEYTERAKSTLKASVQPGHSEPINFDLK